MFPFQFLHSSKRYQNSISDQSEIFTNPNCTNIYNLEKNLIHYIVSCLIIFSKAIFVSFTIFQCFYTSRGQLKI